jgi:hypothetical protein
MGIKTRLTDNDGQGLHFEAIEEYHDFHGTKKVLITTTPLFAHGVFNAVVLDGAATTTVAVCPSGGSLLITDLVISAKKVANTTLTVRFNDGANTEIIIAPDTIEQSTNFSWSPAGRIHGWRDADLQVVTTGDNTDATVTAGYIKFPTGLVFTEWDNVR